MSSLLDGTQEQGTQAVFGTQSNPSMGQDD